MGGLAAGIVFLKKAGALETKKRDVPKRGHPFLCGNHL
jgi:hypothetical protein